MIEEWYSPAEITFSWDECQWIIINVLPLDYGEWPPEPRETGYVGGDKLPSQHASFESACMVAGELLVRLKKTKTDGKLLVAQLQANKGWSLEYEAKMALAYCCGRRRKRMLYSQWLANKKYKTKGARVSKKLGCTRCKGSFQTSDKITPYKYAGCILCPKCADWLKDEIQKGKFPAKGGQRK